MSGISLSSNRDFYANQRVDESHEMWFERMVRRNVCFPILLLIQSIVRGSFAILFLSITISYWDCYPCACTSKGVWKRDVEVRTNQTFWLNCYAIELGSKEESFIEVETLFYASTSCTKNCTLDPGIDSRLSKQSHPSLSLVISTFIWFSSSFIYLLCGTIGILFNVIPLVALFLMYQVMDTTISLSTISFTPSSFIEGNIFETFNSVILSNKSSIFEAYLHVGLNIIQIVVTLHVIRQLGRMRERRDRKRRLMTVREKERRDRKRRPFLRSQLV